MSNVSEKSIYQLTRESILKRQGKNTLPKLANIVLILSVAYVVAQMLADLSSLKLGLVPVPLLGMVAMDMGTLIYPITFTLRDMVHKSLGKRFARKLIIVAAVVNVIMALFFALVSIFPYDPQAGFEQAWDSVLAPVWRIVVASIIAEVISEFIDGEVYSAWVNKIGQRWQWSRVLVSNAVSIPIDSLAFCWLAFGGTMPASVVWAIFWANVAVKAGMTLLSLPLIYTVR